MTDRPVSVSMTLSDLLPGFQGEILKSNISKTVRSRDKVTIEHQYENIPSLSNGTMFDELD